MKKNIFVILYLLNFLVSAQTCKAQTKKEETTEPIIAQNSVSESDECWKEFKELTTKVSVKFCGEVQKDILLGTFKQSKIRRNSYMVVSKNAVYVLGWFDWKLNSEDENSLRKLYDDYSKETLKIGGKGEIKNTKEISINGKIGRETTFAAENSNSLTQRVFYINGKVIYLGFLPDELFSDLSLQVKLRTKFFESLQILEK